VNTGTDRKNLMEDVAVVLTGLDELRSPEFGDTVGFHLAVACECGGDFVRALAVYSDLISREAHVGVDLSYVIFRAAGKLYYAHGIISYHIIISTNKIYN
jgi:hypothetical protein